MALKFISIRYTYSEKIDIIRNEIIGDFSDNHISDHKDLANIQFNPPPHVNPVDIPTKHKITDIHI